MIVPVGDSLQLGINFLDPSLHRRHVVVRGFVRVAQFLGEIVLRDHANGGQNLAGYNRSANEQCLKPAQLAGSETLEE